MANEVGRKQAGMEPSLEKAVENAASIITRNYLDKLEAYEIISPSEEDIDIDALECGAFYRLDRLVYSKEENFLDKLTTIVNVVFAVQCSLVTMIDSDGTSINYYIGILSKEHRGNAPLEKARRNADRTAFRGALSGNLIGSGLAELDEKGLERMKRFMGGTNAAKSIAAVSGIVALRDEENFSIESYVQGIENLVDSLRGMKYSILMIADSVSTGEVQIMKQGYEMLHTQLSTFRKRSVTMTESDVASLSKARTDGIAKGISTGIAMTQSKTMSRGRTASIGVNAGISFIVNAGVNFTGGFSSGEQTGQGLTRSRMEMNQRMESSTEQVGASKSMGRSLELNYENRTVQALLDKIDKHLERLERCESFGAFDCAAYCFADTREEALTAASNYNALLRGTNSSVQASHINTWYRPEDIKKLLRYLESFVHPRFCEKGGRIIVSPASVISGNELAIQVGLPKKSVSGIPVVSMASFGRNLPMPEKEKALALGSLYHMGRIDGEENAVCLDMDSLTMHTFITGSTGAGKSTLIYQMLDDLMQREVSGAGGEKLGFLVIEPAKGEYKNRFGSYKNVTVYGSNAEKTPLLRINPFSFPHDIHVLEHIDRLTEIFNVCWPMYAAMPAVLKESVERAYAVSGWDLCTSRCKYENAVGDRLFPSFADVLRQINLVMEDSDYSSDSKGDYKGALCTRVKSLTNGIYGQMFTADEISNEELFQKNVIVDLSRIGSGETKALIMGLLVMKLQEYRMSEGLGMNLPLRHITVLEEAHNILKRTSPEQDMESANVAGKSVEMLANSIAEMRTYGEGFVIADQSPGLMDLSVIRNTNTKIILRLPDLSDRELVGRASGMNEEQIAEIARFPAFVASVYQSSWPEPVLCKMNPVFSRRNMYRYHPDRGGKEEDDRMDYIKLLLLPVQERNQLDCGYVDSLKKGIYRVTAAAEAKTAFLRYLAAKDKESLQRYRGMALYGFFQADRAFGMARDFEKDFQAWKDHMCEVLVPDMELFDEEERRKIIAGLAMENAVVKGGDESNRLFNEVMRNLG